MAEFWIKLTIHAKDANVLRLARMTGVPADVVLARLIDWFRWVDEHLSSGDMMLELDDVDAIVNWQNHQQADKPSLARAMLDRRIGWLESSHGAAGGCLGYVRVANFERHFGKCAKRRALHQKQTKLARAGGTASAQDGDELRTDCAQAWRTDRRPRTGDREPEKENSDAEKPESGGIEGGLQLPDLGVRLVKALEIMPVRAMLPGRPDRARHTSDVSDLARNILPALADRSADWSEDQIVELALDCRTARRPMAAFKKRLANLELIELRGVSG